MIIESHWNISGFFPRLSKGDRKHSFAFQVPRHSMSLTTQETWQDKLKDKQSEIH